jgi:hypothetical protein
LPLRRLFGNFLLPLISADHEQEEADTDYLRAGACVLTLLDSQPFRKISISKGPEMGTETALQILQHGLNSPILQTNPRQ